MAPIRTASHAGSWYTSNKKELQILLKEHLDRVQQQNGNQRTTTTAQTSTKAVICPHAGYAYSAATAAHSFWDLLGDPQKLLPRRIVLLGPSHHLDLVGRIALPVAEVYQTPVGDLLVDTQALQSLRASGKFASLDIADDEDEHSLEMQMPFLRLLLPASSECKIVPMLVGPLSAQEEQLYAQLLKPLFDDSKTAFVISSDFCHWGSRFGYTTLLAPDSGYPRPGGSDSNDSNSNNTTDRDNIQGSPSISDSIRRLDHLGFDAIRTLDPQVFRSYLSRTRNTICGRAPISLFLAILQHQEPWVRDKIECIELAYAQSSVTQSMRDSSVSYLSAAFRLSP